MTSTMLSPLLKGPMGTKKKSLSWMECFFYIFLYKYHTIFTITNEQVKHVTETWVQAMKCHTKQISFRSLLCVQKYVVMKADSLNTLLYEFLFSLFPCSLHFSHCMDSLWHPPATYYFHFLFSIALRLVWKVSSRKHLRPLPRLKLKNQSRTIKRSVA